MIDIEKSHLNFKQITQNNDVNLQDNLDILLNSRDNLSQEEIVARYVLNLMSIKDIVMENKDDLSTSRFMLQICKNYPFLATIDGKEFYYVAKGIMPRD